MLREQSEAAKSAHAPSVSPRKPLVVPPDPPDALGADPPDPACISAPLDDEHARAAPEKSENANLTP
jgi:hypothetical protein